VMRGCRTDWIGGLQKSRSKRQGDDQGEREAGSEQSPPAQAHQTPPVTVSRLASAVIWHVKLPGSDALEREGPVS